MVSSLTPDLLIALGSIWLGGAGISLALAKAPNLARWAGAFAVGLGALLALIIAVSALLTGSTVRFALFALAPFADFSLRLDPLAAVFVGVIGLGALAVAPYSVGYLRGDRQTGLLGAGLNLFLLSMLLVVLADSIPSFLFAWEAMSLISYLLVSVHHHDAEVRRSAFVYVVMTHVGTVFVITAFLALFAVTGRLDFAELVAAGNRLPAFARDLVFLAALIGFGTKAGIIPLHIWLPRAHPVAPSHISALMSGVMLKTAIYGLLRVTLEFLGPAPWWWGGIIVALGAISAVLGVLYALMQHDLKRLLAYHSVENVGIILLGVGASLILFSVGNRQLAALALVAGLYHTINHAVFKGLLFLGAGAIDKATHTRDLEHLGGLIRRMPLTAMCFLIGSIAISALPPLNGFISEWLTFQSLFALGLQAPPAAGVLGFAASGLLALTGALAAACFVKAFGVAFLALPRSSHVERAKEAPASMLVGMALLAILSVGLGLLAPSVVGLLSAVPNQVYGARLTSGVMLLTIPGPTGAPHLSPVWLLIAVGVCCVIGLLVARVLGGPTRSRIGRTWACGITLLPTMEYTSTAFAKPIRLIFAAILRPHRLVERDYAAAPYFVRAMRYEGGIRPVYEQYLYGPTTAALVATAEQVRRLQNGSVRLYLAYIFVTLIALLILAR